MFRYADADVLESMSRTAATTGRQLPDLAAGVASSLRACPPGAWDRVMAERACQEIASAGSEFAAESRALATRSLETRRLALESRLPRAALVLSFIQGRFAISRLWAALERWRIPRSPVVPRTANPPGPPPSRPELPNPPRRPPSHLPLAPVEPPAGSFATRLEDFFRNTAGQRVSDLQGGYVGECVSLAKRWANEASGDALGAFSPGPDASWRTGSGFDPNKWMKIPAGTENYRIGDLVLFAAARENGGYGHIGIVGSLPDENGRFTIIEQNYPTGRGVRGDRVVSVSAPLGVMRHRQSR